jgi:hypothetical protein
MKWFSFRRRNILHYGALHLSQDYLENPAPRVQQDLAAAGLDYQAIDGKKLLVDFRAEGQCDKTVAALAQYLKTLPFADVMLVFNTVVNTESLPYRAASNPTHLANFAGWFDRLDASGTVSDIDTKFLCLMRRPSPSRARLARGLLDIQSMRLSFGSMSPASMLGDYYNMIPERELPILLDGIVHRETGLEHNQTNIIFKRCLFNIVAESSSQTDPGVWRSQFISEKTFKAFGLRQIPIWFAVPGLVDNVRQLGFAMFDDLVDHNYDQIQDEHRRLEVVLDQIHHLDQLNIEQCQQIKQSVTDRLDHNYNLLRQFAQQSDAWYSQIEKEYDET